jgi:mRNA interferase MazF
LLRRLPAFGDFLVCGLNTQLHQRVAGFDENIAPADNEFAASGLKAASLIRFQGQKVICRLTAATEIL